MLINVLVGIKEIGNAIRRYMFYLMNYHKCKIFLLGNASDLSPESLRADFWLIDAWNFFNDDPEGFRTACKLAGKIKCLLLFYHVPEGFPEEGPFWCNPVKCELDKKIKEVLESPPPEKEDFERLIQIWPELGREPRHHHHHR